MGRLSTWLALAVLGGAFVAGCGSSSSSKANSTSPASSGTSSTSAYQAEIDKVIAACKTTVNAVPSLTASERRKAEGNCEVGGGGPGNNPLEAAHNVAKEVCVEVTNASPLSGAEKHQALVACKSK
jgi:hypothetical protein